MVLVVGIPIPTESRKCLRGAPVMYPLHRPDLPENQKRHLLQGIINKTKIKSFGKCMFGESHAAKAVRGHVVPKNWLKQISVNDEVRVFISLPISGFWDLPVETYTDVEPPTRNLHINLATVRRFTCQPHEEALSPTDSIYPDISDVQILNLCTYRSLIAQLWLESLLELCFREALKITPDDEPFQLQARLHRQNVLGLEQYKKLIEPCLVPDTCRRCKGGKCKVTGHVVRHMPGEPTFAVSQFSSGSRTRANFHFGTLSRIANWGLTIIPIPQGHTAILQYFLEDMLGNPKTQRTISEFQALNGRALEQMISALVLDKCENIAISPKAWDAFGSKRQQAMLYRFRTEQSDVGFGSREQIKKWNREHFQEVKELPTNPRQLNMFRY